MWGGKATLIYFVGIFYCVFGWEFFTVSLGGINHTQDPCGDVFLKIKDIPHV